MRFWLWLTTGMVTKEWVAIHRKHHRFTDLDGDPHTPVKYGIWTVLFQGALLYKVASKDQEMVNSYGKGTPDDWIERNVYSRYSLLGVLILLYINLLLLGYYGIGVWLLQMAWIPFWAAGVVNGVGHHVGYRNSDTKDKSTNIFPLDVMVGGELLHNNHHNNPASPKLSLKWFEFDIGWMYLKIFETFKLAKINYGNSNT